MNRINGGHSPKLSSAGTYTLDGNQAVAYSRIRYTAGGDLARAGRQREVLQKILTKNGVHVVMSREEDTALCEENSSEIKKRFAI